MTDAFKNILLPVDFTFNTQVAVKKAIELVEPEAAVIHLLHIMKPVYRFSLNSFRLQLSDAPADEHYEEAVRKLQQWKRIIEETIVPVQIQAEVQFDSDINSAVIKKAKTVQPDLIIVGEHTQPGGFYFKRKIAPAKIALQTGTPLLILKPGCIYNKVKTVVVPVAGFKPERKIEMLIALKRKFRIRVHLVTILDNRDADNDFSSQALLETYRMLKDNLRFPVEYQVLHGNNRAKATLQYAQSIGADMVLVNPETETKVTTFTCRHINDILLPESRLQILEVEPKK
jgi:nucleotide-binding universal stress UspA family protein